jgi:hypothetical protein
MTDKATPDRSPKVPSARQERLKVALKANLSRRKAQARARKGTQKDNKAG